MDSFQNPVGNQPRDPYENYKVEPIEKDKSGKENPPEDLPDKKALVGAQVLLLFRKFIDFFEDLLEKGSVEKKMKDHLLLLKKALELLKTEDRSQDIPFLNHLSDLWSLLLEDSFQFRKQTPISLKFKSLIKSIQGFPQSQEHTLGYYLIEHAGQKWLPFPFMEIVQKLHSEHQKNPTSSTLESWIKQIAQLINVE
ncbi:MAG TPA: hypothetical protein VLE89_06060 [Chlamydiales bacterium]|nr:hypothetical protein [Chlamydiales bacterium]